MSIVSELKKRAGQRVRVRDAPPSQSYSGAKPVKLVLRPPATGRVGGMFEIARLLRRAGVSVRGAKQAVDSLLRGEAAYVCARHIADYDNLVTSLTGQNVTVHRILQRKIDVKGLRKRLGISQAAFAGQFGLGVATLQNWEQGRTTPKGPAAVLLQLIDSDPDKVIEMLAS